MKKLINIGMVLLVSLVTYAQSASSTNDIFRGNIQFYFTKAENLFRQGDPTAALVELDRAVQLAPQHPEVYIQRAMLKYRMGLANAAQQDVLIAGRLNPLAPQLFGIDGPKTQLDLLAFYPETLYQKLSWSQQIAHYETILTEWEESLYSEEVTDDLPELEEVVIQLDAVLTDLNNRAWDKALDGIASLELYRGNTSLIYNLRGLIHLEKSAFEKASSSFRRAIYLDPNNEIAWFNFAKLSQELKQYESSLTYLNKVLTLNPTLDKAYFERALVKKELGDLDGAIADYTNIIQRQGSPYLRAVFNRAICLKKIGQLTPALEDINYILEQEPDNSLAWKIRGNLRLLFGDFDEAITDFTEAINLDKKLGVAYFNRGIAHLLNDNPLTACMDFEQSADIGYERAVNKQHIFCSN